MRENLTRTFRCLFISALLFSFTSCQKNAKDDSANLRPGGGNDISPNELKNFVQVNLVGNSNTDKPINQDPNLMNGWGIAFTAAGAACVSSEAKGISATYNLDGVAISNAINIPFAGSQGTGHPTALVINPSSDFKLPNGNPAECIFATADGTISGWNDGKSAVKMIDRSPSASYLGVAIANDNNGNFFIYAANFAQGRIEVFDKNWNAVNKPFVDPDMPADYAPFNIQTVSDGRVFVTYAKKNSTGQKVAGAGNGFINVYNPEGILEKRFASKGKLNAPWGMTKAPGGFWGEWSQIPNTILVGNSGDGHINAFDDNGNFIGQLHTKGKLIEIDGLWGLAFPPINGLNRYNMYFASGGNDGKNGLVGYIKMGYIN